MIFFKEVFSHNNSDKLTVKEKLFQDHFFLPFFLLKTKNMSQKRSVIRYIDKEQYEHRQVFFTNSSAQTTDDGHGKKTDR
jgi:hypothetical protein